MRASAFVCSNAELCCVLAFAGKPALPALLGRGNNLAGPSGYWVGHSSGCFAVELLSDREPGLAPGSRGFFSTRLAKLRERGDHQGATVRAASRASGFIPEAQGVPSRCTPVLFMRAQERAGGAEIESKIKRKITIT